MSTDTNTAGPDKPSAEADAVIDCARSLVDEFQMIYNSIVSDGMSEVLAAQSLLNGDNEPRLAVLAADAVEAGWPTGTASRAALGLARINLRRAKREQDDDRLPALPSGR